MALAAVGRPRRAEWTGPPIDASVTRVRHALRQVLVRWRLPNDVVDDAVLVITELLANVVEHARTPFRVVAELRVRVLYLAVADEGAGRAPIGMGCAISGYVSGLRLVNAVALRWGWQQHETGKTVWAEFLT
jgi:anti-sigma regulatory factor (Ser/Thr protein kinase)